MGDHLPPSHYLTLAEREGSEPNSDESRTIQNRITMDRIRVQDRLPMNLGKVRDRIAINRTTEYR